MAVIWSYENAAHLLRRAAFGGTPVEIQAFLDRHASVQSAVDELLSFEPSRKKPPGGKRINQRALRKMQTWWIKQMIRTRTVADACREKLVLFLHDHLASGLSKQPWAKYMALQNRLFRTSAKGSFRDLMRAFNRDPANLYYLDGILNVASNDGVHVNANENWGRELVELFTLGVLQLGPDGTPDPSRPNYTESDVHNLARASTGWTSIARNVGQWNPDDWDGGRYDDDGDGLPDPMTIFGQTSNGFRIDDAVAGSSDDILELIFSRVDDEGNNQVGIFLAWKLWTWYAYPSPAPGLKALLAGLAASFQASNFELASLVRAIWTHDEFYGDRAKSRTVRNPVDFIVGAFKALGVSRAGRFVPGTRRELGDAAAGMGMDLFEPPNVAGWPGGLSWITSGSLLERMRFARDFAAADRGGSRIRLEEIEGLPLGDPAADPQLVVDAVLHQLGLDAAPLALNTTQRAALVDFASAGGLLPTLNLENERTDEARFLVRGVIALALQAAEAQVF